MTVQNRPLDSLKTLYIFLLPIIQDDRIIGVKGS